MQTSKIRILIVDDDFEMLEMYRDLFEIEGFEMVASSSPLEALEIYKNNKNIKIIISDSNMREMSGLDFLRSLKELYKTIPIFYIVTGDLDHSEESIKLLGGHGLVLKPFDLDEILIKIRADLKI